LRGGMGLDALVNAVVVRPVFEIAEFAQGAVPAATELGASSFGGVIERDAEIVFSPLRHPNVHRYVAGLALGALAFAFYLLIHRT